MTWTLKYGKNAKNWARLRANYTTSTVAVVKLTAFD
jgi:hypothetical protein